ncbi:MAG: type II toxin-antitoxin system VapC family toxin [Chloroflexota bacterium]
MAVLFFDTSALVRRYDLREPGAAAVHTLCRRSSRHVLLIARLAVIETASALNRKSREGRLDRRDVERLWRLFRAHWRAQYHVIALEDSVYRAAEQLLFAHSLRAYDALQLATALRAAGLLGELAPDYRFCTADGAQADAARREGLSVELIG